MEPYYRHDLVRVHHQAFAGHADRCAPGILALLQPVLRRRGLVLELGCGSGHLTRHLVRAGHRVIATDASPAMLEIAQTVGAEDTRILSLPHDSLPPSDAIVSVGHVLNYLPDRLSVERTLGAMARALSPGGILAFDLLDLGYAEARGKTPTIARVEENWAVISVLSLPQTDRIVREITTFTRQGDGAWRRDDERHENVLVDVHGVPALLAACGVEACVSRRFGDEELTDGMFAVVGRSFGDS